MYYHLYSVHKIQNNKTLIVALFLEHLIPVINCYNILICDEYLKIIEIRVINTF